MYCSLEESPVSGRITALMVDGKEDILLVRWKGRVLGYARGRGAGEDDVNLKARREHGVRRAVTDMRR